MKKNIESELDIVKDISDKLDKYKSKLFIKNSRINEISKIAEDFIKKKGFICYGGTAINDILPKKDRFYDKKIDIPDYDVYSTNAMENAKELSDIYFKNGFKYVEAKSAVHTGTYKVQVDFIPIVDITELSKNMFNKLNKEVITINKMKYASPNFLRMSMYKELSQPLADPSRWEKVFKRLNLLNKTYPLSFEKCVNKTLQKKMTSYNCSANKETCKKIYNIILNYIQVNELVIFGTFSNLLYNKYSKQSNVFKDVYDSDFDVLSEHPLKVAKDIKIRLERNGFGNVFILKKKELSEYIGEYYIIQLNNDHIMRIYKPLACFGYNNIKINNKIYKIASLDTLSHLYLTFYYSDRTEYNTDHLLCVASFLFDIMERHSLKSRKLLKRLNTPCYGTQHTIHHILKERFNLSLQRDIDKKRTEKIRKSLFKYVPLKKSLKQQKQHKHTKKNKSDYNLTIERNVSNRSDNNNIDNVGILNTSQ